VKKLLPFVAGTVLVAFAAASAEAADALALLKKMDGRMYYPQANGLKDLGATMTVEGEGAQAAPFYFKLYWKAPDKKACRLELMPEMANNPMAGMIRQMAAQMQQQMVSVVDMVVPERALDRQSDFDYTAEADGALTKITGKRKATAKDTKLPEETVLWIDAQATPIKLASVQNGVRSEMGSLKYEDKDGKLLLGSAEITAGGKTATIKTEYKSIDKLWLVCAVRMGGGGGAGTILIKDHAVNKGVDDAVFTDSKAPEKKGD
jgi:hypothetical protein